MQEESDWRRTIPNDHLMGVTLVKQKYGQYAKNPKWDHDHCEFCTAKFMLGGNADVLDHGYSTEEQYHWICETCFADFHEEFGWKVVVQGDKKDEV